MTRINLKMIVGWVVFLALSPLDRASESLSPVARAADQVTYRTAQAEQERLPQTASPFGGRSNTPTPARPNAKTAQPTPQPATAQTTKPASAGAETSPSGSAATPAPTSPEPGPALPEEEVPGKNLKQPELSLPGPQPSQVSEAPEEGGPTEEGLPQPGGAGSSPQKGPRVSFDGDQMVFNFDNADIHEVVSTIGDVLGLNYMIDPKLTGVVNIHTSGKIRKKDLFSVLETLLRINSFTIVKQGDLYNIVPMTGVNAEYLPLRTGLKKDDTPLTDEFVMQIVPLRFVSPKEMADVLKPLLTQGASTITKDNLLIILEFSANIKKLLSLIEVFDVDTFDQLHIQVNEVKNADVDELAAELDSIFKALDLPPERTARSGGISFVPITRVKMLLAVSSNEQLLEKAGKWVKELDSSAGEGSVKIFVYRVQNGKATDIADVLNQVFTGGGPQKETTFKSKLREKTTTTTSLSKSTEKQTEKPAEEKKPATTLTSSPKATSFSSGGQKGELTSGEVTIVVDEVNNAIIVEATDRDYRIVEKAIRELDVYPRQVLIEVMIAEIRLDDALKLGMEWEYSTTNGSGDTSTVNVSGISATDFLAAQAAGGLRYLLDMNNGLKMKLLAYANDDKVNVLSSPHILASDNKEASIEIANEEPYSTGTTTTTTGTAVVTTSVEYRTTGLILKVTPHINDRGLVNLDVSQEVSEKSGNTAVGDTVQPVFSKRVAQTTMTVQDGQTVIIGGLIRERKEGTKSGVPILSRIPILGAAFGFHNNATERTELLMVLTPRVMTSAETADEVTNEFKSKLSIINATSSRGMERWEKQELAPKSTVPKTTTSPEESTTTLTPEKDKPSHEPEKKLSPEPADSKATPSPKEGITTPTPEKNKPNAAPEEKSSTNSPPKKNKDSGDEEDQE